MSVHNHINTLPKLQIHNIASVEVLKSSSDFYDVFPQKHAESHLPCSSTTRFCQKVHYRSFPRQVVGKETTVSAQ